MLERTQQVVEWDLVEGVVGNQDGLEVAGMYCRLWKICPGVVCEPSPEVLQEQWVVSLHDIRFLVLLMNLVSWVDGGQGEMSVRWQVTV